MKPEQSTEAPKAMLLHHAMILKVLNAKLAAGETASGINDPHTTVGDVLI